MCAPKGLAESRAHGGVGLKDSQRQQHRGEGVLPILPGVYPCLSRTVCSEEQAPRTLQVVFSCTQE